MVTVIIIDESKKSSTWLKAADSEKKTLFASKVVVFVGYIARGKGKKRRLYIGLNLLTWGGVCIADPQGEESNDDDG